MKIAMIIPSLKNTAPNNIALSICAGARNYGVNIDIYYLDDIVELNVAESELNISKLNDRTILNSYDIIHSHGLRPDIINFKAKKNVINISTLHSFILDDLKNKYGIKGYIIAFAWLKLLKRFDSCIAISKATKRFYAKHGLKCHHIYNGIDFPGIEISRDNLRQGSKRLNNGKINIVSIAHLEKIKGLEQLLYLAAEREEFHVHIIGEGSYRGKLSNIIDKFELSQRVTLHGYIPNASAMLGQFDVYVQPSISEGFGIAVIEALVNKIPTVCSDIEVFKELFGLGEVEFFKLGNINSLCDAISSAITKTDVSRDASATTISQKFSSEVMSLNYLSWYKQLYEERNL